MADKISSGKCACEAVQYEVTGEPMWKLVCYCPDCSRASGGAGHLVSLLHQLTPSILLTRGADLGALLLDGPLETGRRF